MDAALGTLNDASDLLLTGSVARLLNVSAETVRLWERTGRLPAIRVDGRVRLFERRDVQRLARERELAATGNEAA
jgi:excisionase family DNA binding protein